MFCLYKMPSTFYEYYKNKSEFNINLHNCWINIFKQTLDNVVIDFSITYLLEYSFLDFKHFKRFLNKKKISYQKTDNKNKILLNKQNAINLFFKYGIPELKLYLAKLPLLIYNYENYILENQIQIYKKNSQ